MPTRPNMPGPRSPQHPGAHEVGSPQVAAAKQQPAVSIEQPLGNNHQEETQAVANGQGYLRAALNKGA